jgi:gentisate 1,2-dioxygenase
MERGDLILTPFGLWHEHGHEGSEPVIWMDALDLPTLFHLEASYCIEGEPQIVRNQPDASQTAYRRAGLAPFGSLNRARDRYPLKRFPWNDTRAALHDLATVVNRGDPVQLAYVNPETGDDCMPVLGFSALMLRPGETLQPRRRSASAVLHVVEGEGRALVDGVELDFGINDTFAAPTHARIEITNRSSSKPAFLFQVDDAPMQRKLGFVEEFAAAA